MFTFAYPAEFRRDEDGRLLVRLPDFPTAHTDGADTNEAMEEAIDCLGSVLKVRETVVRRPVAPTS